MEGLQLLWQLLDFELQGESFTGCARFPFLPPKKQFHGVKRTAAGVCHQSQNLSLLPQPNVKQLGKKLAERNLRVEKT